MSQGDWISHGEPYGPESVAPPVDRANAPADRGMASDSNTREYVSLPGSPHGDHDPSLPLIGVDWDLDEIYMHLPVNQRERAQRVHVIFKEYLKTHLMALFPGQPDMIWDYCAWWTQSERRNFTVFNDIIVHGSHGM